MKATATNERIGLSLNEAFKIIDTWAFGVVSNKYPSSERAKVHFDFDEIRIERDSLIFGRENCDDQISFRLADINDSIYMDYSNESKFIHFSLTTGEEWFAMRYGDRENPFRPREKYNEIELDEFLEKLEKSCKVGVHHVQSHIKTNIYFDAIYTEDTADDHDWGGDRKVKVIFGDTSDKLVESEIDLDEYNTKFYLALDADFSIIYIGLYDTPFTELVIMLFYNED